MQRLRYNSKSVENLVTIDRERSYSGYTIVFNHSSDCLHKFVMSINAVLNYFISGANIWANIEIALFPISCHFIIGFVMHSIHNEITMFHV